MQRYKEPVAELFEAASGRRYTTEHNTRHSTWVDPKRLSRSFGDLLSMDGGPYLFLDSVSGEFGVKTDIGVLTPAKYDSLQGNKGGPNLDAFLTVPQKHFLEDARSINRQLRERLTPPVCG